MAHEPKDELSHWPLLSDKVIVTSHIAHSYVNTDKMCHIRLWKGSFRAVQRILFLLCPQCNLSVINHSRYNFFCFPTTNYSKPYEVWWPVSEYMHMSYYMHWDLLHFLKYCASWFWLDVLQGAFLNQWKNFAIFHVLSGLLVLPYFYECNIWLHHFLPHTDCSREHLTVQHLKRTPHPGLTGRWNSSVNCSVNFELLKTVDCV